MNSDLFISETQHGLLGKDAPTPEYELNKLYPVPGHTRWAFLIRKDEWSFYDADERVCLYRKLPEGTPIEPCHSEPGWVIISNELRSYRAFATLQRDMITKIEIRR
jgi:hypothetical protein